MAKKKKHRKKKSQYRATTPQNKQVTSSVVTGSDSVATSVSAAPQGEKADQAKKVRSALGETGTEVQVKREIRHSLTLLGVILVGLIVLWAVFAHTSFGPYVYRLFKI